MKTIKQIIACNDAASSLPAWRSQAGVQIVNLAGAILFLRTDPPAGGELMNTKKQFKL